MQSPPARLGTKFCFMLATLLAPVIGHVRLFQTAKDKLPNVLEWSTDSDTRASVFLSGPANLATEMVQLRDSLENLLGPRSASDIDVFLGLSFDPSDESLSIDVTTEPILEGEDLATLAAASTAATSPRVEDFHVPLDDVYFTASKAAELLGVDKSTITRRIGKNELIGFRIFKNALRIPKDQFKDAKYSTALQTYSPSSRVIPSKAIHLSITRPLGPFSIQRSFLGTSLPGPSIVWRATSIDRPVSAVLEELALAKQSLDYGDHI